jgi:hypothetical protein
MHFFAQMMGLVSVIANREARKKWQLIKISPNPKL